MAFVSINIERTNEGVRVSFTLPFSFFDPISKPLEWAGLPMTWRGKPIAWGRA